MEEEKLVFNVSGLEGNELIVRHGEALEQHDPVKTVIEGQIDAVYRWIKLRLSQFIKLKQHIVVDIDRMTIRFLEDENNPFGTVVWGKLELSKIFQKFQINTGHEWTTFELADFVRMNRSYFATPNAAAELVTTLRNFKAKIEKEKELSDDKRGNTSMVLRQIVESNLPKSFSINIPIFKGREVISLECEVDINPANLNCQLVSPQAEEIKQTSVENIINEQVDKIKELAPDIVIINV